MRLNQIGGVLDKNILKEAAAELFYTTEFAGKALVINTQYWNFTVFSKENVTNVDYEPVERQDRTHANPAEKDFQRIYAKYMEKYRSRK